MVVPSTTATPEVWGGTVAVTVVPERGRTAMVWMSVAVEGGGLCEVSILNRGACPSTIVESMTSRPQFLN